MQGAYALPQSGYKETKEKVTLNKMVPKSPHGIFRMKDERHNFVEFDSISTFDG